MQPNLSIMFNNNSYLTPSERISDYCIKGVNNPQTIIILSLNIILFAILYIITSKEYYKVKNKRLQIKKLGYLVMTLLNLIVLYYWIVA